MYPYRSLGSSTLNSLFYLALGQLKPQQLHREEFLFKAAASKDFQSRERDSNQQTLTDLPASGPESVRVVCVCVFVHLHIGLKPSSSIQRGSEQNLPMLTSTLERGENPHRRGGKNCLVKKNKPLAFKFKEMKVNKVEA